MPLTSEQGIQPANGEPKPTESLTHKEKWIIGVILLAVLLVGLAFASMSKNPSQASPISPSWHQAASYSGTGNENTTSFQIRGTQIRIHWEYHTTATYDFFFVFLYYNTDNSAPLWHDCASTNPNDLECYLSYTHASVSGDQYVSQGPGTFFFQTIALGQWNVTVSDYY